MLKALAAAAVALLAGDVLSPAQAQASCGPYVRTHRSGEAEPADEGMPRLPPAPTPCSGPECSRGDEGPVSLPQAPTWDSDHWACLNVRPLLDPADLSGLLCPTSLLLPRNDGSSIFHPPCSQ